MTYGLHNNNVLPLQKATNQELDNSIEWYKAHIRYLNSADNKFDQNILLKRCKTNLIACFQERTKRIGK